MNKRNFLRKGASLVGSGALLGSTFMPGSSAGAVNYKEMCQSMLNESWKYFFARMLAAIGIVFWRNRLEKETYEAVPQRLRENIKKLIDENFESEMTGYNAETLKRGNNIDCRGWRFVNNINLCVENTIDYDEYSNKKTKYVVYCYDLDREGYRVIKGELCKIESLEKAPYDKASDFFEKLDYYVTLAKMNALVNEREDLFFKEYVDDNLFFKARKNFYVENKKVNFVQLHNIKDKNLKNTTAYIELIDGERRVALQNFRNDKGNDFKTLEKMTKYMKEILKQAEENYGVKVLGKENKKMDKVGKGNISMETKQQIIE